MSILQSRRHRSALVGITVFAAGGVVLVLAWFEPQKLLIDREVDEAPPGVLSQLPESGGRGAADDRASANGAKTQRLVILAEGDFRGLAHPASGRALLLEAKGSDRYLRFEGLRVENGPDLRVYLSAAPSDSDGAAFGKDFIDLGPLKGNIGDQNYRMPEGIDVEMVNSAVIWCRRFSVGFAVASIAE